MELYPIGRKVLDVRSGKSPLRSFFTWLVVCDFKKLKCMAATPKSTTNRCRESGYFGAAWILMWRKGVWRQAGPCFLSFCCKHSFRGNSLKCWDLRWRVLKPPWGSTEKAQVSDSVCSWVNPWGHQTECWQTKWKNKKVLYLKEYIVLNRILLELMI